MIIKILSSVSNFEGIDYSERKNDQGKSRLLKANNFEALGHSNSSLKKADYINYMKLVCDANPRVKNRQFHAVISAKGQSYSPERLNQIAEQYLKDMGYGKNPYLIYFHGDTQNNHVHMVSTRVDKNGNKVDDTYEKIRSQKVIQEILGQNVGQEVRLVFDKAMEFNFSTKAQMKLLMEQEGIKVSEDGDTMKLIKYGVVLHNIDQEKIKQKLLQYQLPEKRISQLYAIFSKHKKGRDFKQFINFLHKKFGIKIIPHQHRGHDRPYGYTIIDYPEKQIMKGSQVIELRKLLVPAKPDDRNDLYHKYYDQVNFEQTSIAQFKDAISYFGFNMDNKGFVTYEAGRFAMFIVDRKDFELMKQYDRLNYAMSFYAESNSERLALARVFRIPENRIPHLDSLEKDMMKYYHSFFSGLGQTRNAEQAMRRNKIRIIKHQENYFIIDSRNKYVVDLNRLPDVNIQNLPITILDFNKEIENEKNIDNGSARGAADLFQLFNLPLSNEDNSKQKNKRKQSRKV
jgi:hypothetical protein